MNIITANEFKQMLEEVNWEGKLLPEGLNVGGDLNLSYTPITSLPNGLNAGGDLYLSHTPITSLPEGLEVRDDLYLSYTPITSLPNRLKIGRNLYILKNIPIHNIQVGGKIIYSY